MPAECRKDIEMMIEIESLLKELESDGVEAERKKELVRGIKKMLRKYESAFGGERDAEDLLRGYRERFKKALEKPAA